MPLSPKQLRLVFARLREKGLLKYVKKSRIRSIGTTAEAPVMPISEAGKEILDSILTKDKVKGLLSRLPEGHRKLSLMSKVRIWDGEVLGRRELAGGYNVVTGEISVSRSPILYATKKGYSDKPLHVPRGSLLSKARYVRNAKVGAVKAFYHEYGHSIWDGRLSGELKRRFPVMGEWDGVPREEAFSESYGAYAATKYSRNRLKRERPLSYSYMKKFFEEK